MTSPLKTRNFLKVLSEARLWSKSKDIRPLTKKFSKNYLVNAETKINRVRCLTHANVEVVTIGNEVVIIR